MGELEHEAYRACVGIVLFNSSGLVFTGERIDTPGAWQMPQGGIDAGEDPLTAAWRELAEETGIRKAFLLDECEDWLTYDLPEELRHKIWGGRYRGQRQKWFAFRFEGRDADIDLAASAHREFTRWRWTPLADIPATIVAFKRPIYEALVDRFAHLAQSG